MSSVLPWFSQVGREIIYYNQFIEKEILVQEN